MQMPSIAALQNRSAIDFVVVLKFRLNLNTFCPFNGI